MSKELLEAVQKNSLEQAKVLLEKGANANFRDEKGDFPLKFAVANGSMEMLNLLLTHKADLKQQDAMGYTPLMFAAKQSKNDCAEYLIKHMKEKNMDFETTDNDGNTALTFAANNYNQKLAEALVNNGANLIHQNKRNETPLMRSVLSMFNGCSKFLIEEMKKRKLGFEHKDVDGNTALMIAIPNKNMNIAKILVAAGASLQQKNGKGQSLLMLACSDPKNAGLLQLLEKIQKEDLEQVDSHGFTALSLAAHHGNLPAIKILVANNANLLYADWRGRNPLMIAISNKHNACAQYLMDHMQPSDWERRNVDGYTALHFSVTNSNLEGLKILAQRVNLDPVNRGGLTPLMLAVQFGMNNFVECLAQAMRGVGLGAFKFDRINEQDGGYTALMYAASYGNIAAAKILLAGGGANVHHKNSKGRTSLLISIIRNQFEMAKFLLENGANIADQDLQGESVITALGWNQALSDKAVEYVQFFLNRGMFLDLPLRRPGESPLPLQAIRENGQQYRDMGMVVYSVLQAADKLFTVLEAQKILEAQQKEKPQSKILDQVNLQKFLELLNFLGIGVNGRRAKSGNTALHLAVQLDTEEFAEPLILAGGNVEFLNNDIEIKPEKPEGKEGKEPKEQKELKEAKEGKEGKENGAEKEKKGSIFALANREYVDYYRALMNIVKIRQLIKQESLEKNKKPMSLAQPEDKERKEHKEFKEGKESESRPKATPPGFVFVHPQDKDGKEIKEAREPKGPKESKEIQEGQAQALDKPKEKVLSELELEINQLIRTTLVLIEKLNGRLKDKLNYQLGITLVNCDPVLAFQLLDEVVQFYPANFTQARNLMFQLLLDNRVLLKSESLDPRDRTGFVVEMGTGEDPTDPEELRIRNHYFIQLALETDTDIDLGYHGNSLITGKEPIFGNGKLEGFTGYNIPSFLTILENCRDLHDEVATLEVYRNFSRQPDAMQKKFIEKEKELQSVQHRLANALALNRIYEAILGKPAVGKEGQARPLVPQFQALGLGGACIGAPGAAPRSGPAPK